MKMIKIILLIFLSSAYLISSQSSSPSPSYPFESISPSPSPAYSFGSISPSPSPAYSFGSISPSPSPTVFENYSPSESQTVTLFIIPSPIPTITVSPSSTTSSTKNLCESEIIYNEVFNINLFDISFVINIRNDGINSFEPCFYLLLCTLFI